MKPIYLILLFLFCFIFLLFLVYVIYRFYRYKIAKIKIEELLTAILNEHKNPNNRLIKEKKKIYDYYLETLTTNYYIKVIYNYNNYEISINSRYSWQYKKDINDDKIRFIDGVVDFVNFKPFDKKKETVKLCLIYPNSRSLLYYINEPDISFIRPEEFLYGIKFITYERLNNNHNYI